MARFESYDLDMTSLTGEEYEGIITKFEAGEDGPQT